MENSSNPSHGLEVPVSGLQLGVPYWIAAEADRAVGVYTGSARETYAEPSDAEKEEMEESDDDWSKQFFCSGGDELRLLGEVAVRKFTMLPNHYDPWAARPVVQNVTSWQIARKWRPSRIYSIDIPEAAAVGRLKFYPAGSVAEALGFDLSSFPAGSRFRRPMPAGAVRRLCESIDDQRRH